MTDHANRGQPRRRYVTRLDPVWSRRWRSLDVWRDEPIGEEFQRFCSAHATDLFVVDGPQRLTFGEFDLLVDKLAAALQLRGIGPGDTIAFQLPSWWEALVITHAVFRLGAVITPIAPNLRAHELRYILDVAAPKASFFPERFRSAYWADILKDVQLSEGDVFGVRGSFGSQSLDSLIDEASGQLEKVPVDPLTPALLLFTSGSTSAPKGVLHGHNGLIAEARSLQGTHGITNDDVMLMPYPITHIGGFSYGALLPFVSGLTVVLLDVWEPEAALTLMVDEGVTFLSAVPTVIDSLLASEGFRPEAADSVRLITMGGTRVTKASVLSASRNFRCVCKRGYGMTEMPTFTSTPGDLNSSNWATSDGLPTGVSQIRVVDENGQAVPEGISGEILAQGPELFMGYLDPDLNEQAFTEDGWFRTGDLGMLDHHGAIRIDGRKKDIIIRNGENISATEVEELLLNHPSVMDVAVVAVSDPEVGERACAVVVPSGLTFTMIEMVEFLNEASLAKFKYPELLVLRDGLPTTPNGKIRKDLLRSELNVVSPLPTIAK
jgi:cyclohexanecarboxylate-CoA ligase